MSIARQRRAPAPATAASAAPWSTPALGVGVRSLDSARLRSFARTAAGERRPGRRRTARAPGRARPARSAAARRGSRRRRRRRRPPSRGAAPGRRRGGAAARPSATVAPTMIGSATVRESRFAWSREKRAPAGGGQGRAVAGDAGGQRRRLGDAEREAVGRASPRRARAAAAGGRRATIAAAPASSPKAVARGPPSRRSIGRSSV